MARTQLHLRERLAAAGKPEEFSVAEDLLYGAPNPLARSKYDPDYHPVLMLNYFRAALDAMKTATGEVERIETKQGDVRYVRRPVSPPTLSGFAAEVGTASTTLQKWAEEFPEFREVWDLCRDIQLQVFAEMGAHSAYSAPMTSLMLKNLLGWQEKAETTHRGGVVIHVDAEDVDA